MRKELWTEERILATIRQRAVDGYCGTKDQTLCTVARRKFGSWADACLRAGVQPLSQRDRYTVCSIEGCDAEVRSSHCQWCEKHYYRNRRNGSPTKLYLKQYTLNESIFDSWTPDNAWLLGVLWSDGWINGTVIGFKSKDEQFVSDVRRVLGTNVEIKIEQGKYYRISVASRKISDRLREIGMCEAKSLIIQWPAGMPLELDWHFIRGIIDGDGWVWLKSKRKGQKVKDCRVGVVSGSGDFIASLLEHSQANGMVCTARSETPKSQGWNIKYTWNVSHQNSLRLLVEQLYPSPDVPCLHRKRDLLLEFYNTPRFSAGNPQLKLRREERRCVICTDKFTATKCENKVCCGDVCGRIKAWQTRKKNSDRAKRVYCGAGDDPFV